MRLSKFALLAALCCGASASAADGPAASPELYGGSGGKALPAAGCDCGEPVCGCEPVLGATGCDDGCDAFGLFGHGHGGGLLGGHDCCLGQPYSLFGEHCGWNAGGWVQMGYHNNALPLMNSRPHEYQLHQAWLYAEKEVDTRGGFDIGGRIDYVYGTDGQDTQAFGIPNDHWDNNWDHGNDYGHALPQVYLEAGYGDLTVKAGHFYSPIGYEAVAAPENFFYSHSYTMYHSEPWTHTGTLATYRFSEDVEIYGGHVFGWDSGYEDNGDALLGGFSLAMTDRWTLTYMSVMGRFNDNAVPNERGFANERGYMHSIVNAYQLTDRWQYVSWSDVLSTEDEVGNTARETFSYNQSLLYAVNDCLKLGGRFEWYEEEGVFTPVGDETDIYALTLGANYRPHANVVIRPEIRWDWVDGDLNSIAAAGNQVLEDNDDEQTTFGIDTIFTF